MKYRWKKQVIFVSLKVLFSKSMTKISKYVNTYIHTVYVYLDIYTHTDKDVKRYILKC